MHTIIVEKLVEALPVVLIIPRLTHTSCDLVGGDLELIHDFSGALLCQFHPSTQACEVHFVQVLEEDVVVHFIFHVADDVVDAKLSQILHDELMVCNLWILCRNCIFGGCETELSISDAVGIFDLLRTPWAFKGQDARDENGIVFQSVLILV